MSDSGDNPSRKRQSNINRRNMLLGGTTLAAASALTPGNSNQVAQAQQQPATAAAAKPNILVIFGDDIGQTNLSCYSFGLMGYKTPNIDRIAKEGMMFTDYYAENSCTAGRSTFITGQSCKRIGLSKVGLPGATVGLQDRDVTIAQALKPLGYATGQFGKNHLGDLDKYLPTNHGFDEFFGNLYHLNAEEEPEVPTFPSGDPLFKQIPRGVMHSYADGRVEDTRAAQPEADGDHRRRDDKRLHGMDQETGPGWQTVLLLDEHDAHAPVHTCAPVDDRTERYAGQLLCRRHDRARWRCG
jgi:arylsulfatase A-like enzyme